MSESVPRMCVRHLQLPLRQAIEQAIEEALLACQSLQNHLNSLAARVLLAQDRDQLQRLQILILDIFGLIGIVRRPPTLLESRDQRSRSMTS